MPGRCVAGGCSAFPDVEKGLVLHAIPFYNDDRPEARKHRKKWVDFVKQKRAKWEPTRNSSLCSRHFTEDDFIRRFTFADETSGKPIIPRLKRDELGINVFPTIHPEVVNKTPVLSESAKRRQERQVRIVNCADLIDSRHIYVCKAITNILKKSIYYCSRRSKMRRGE